MATQFQVGEERVRNGWVYRRGEAGRWAPIRPANDAGGPTLPRVIEGPPDTRRDAADRRAEEDQAMERERLRLAREAAARSDPPSGFRWTAAGALEPIPGGPADPATPTTRSTRQLPETANRRLGDGTSSLLALDRALSNFNEDFAGNTVTGELENWAQGRFSSLGTPGQRDWWADVYATDNIARNELFGASLTEGEKASWERTTVNPSMAPTEVRRNLQRRREIAEGALRRLARTYRANGFNEEAIRESLGEVQGLIDAPAAAGTPAGARGAGDEQAPSPAGPIAFLDDAVPPQSDGPTPAQQQYRARLQAALNNGTIRDYASFQSFARANAAELGLDPDMAARASTAEAVRQAVTAARRGERNAVVDPPRPAPAPPPNRGTGESTAPLFGIFESPEELDSTVRGAADVLSMGLADEIAAAGDTVFRGGTMGENLYNQRGIDRYDSTNYPVRRLAGQFGAGFLLPTFGATRAREISALSGAYGGAYGFGSGEGGFGDRLGNAAETALVSTAIAAPLAFAGTRLAARPPARSAFGDPAEAVAAADRQGIDLLPADVGGGTLRRFTAGVNQSPIGGAQITAGAERTARQFGDRVGAIAAAEGTPVRQEVLGETVEGAFRRFNENSGAEGSAAYANARRMAGDRDFIGMRAVQRIDDSLIELGENPSTNGPLIAGLERLRSDLAQPEAGLKLKSIDAMRQLRTSTRAEAQTEGLRGTDYQRRAREALDGLSEDIAADLPPAAAEEFRRADNLWRERLDFIDDVEERLLGPRGDRSAERVTKSLMEMTRGDSARFERVLGQVTPSEAGIIRGSVIQEMGRPAPGNPAPFSIETWARNYRSLPDRTRAALFRGESRQHAEDLLTIAERVEGTNRYRNTSSTAGAAAVIDVLRMITSGAAAWGTYGGTLGAEAAAGRLLASPGFARWLARPPRQRSTAIRRLSNLAAREPSLAPDIDPIRLMLEGGANRAAAEEGTDQPR